MFTVIIATSLAFALNTEPEPQPYGPQLAAPAAPAHIPAPDKERAMETVAPGTVRPASYTRKTHSDEHYSRNYACVDDGCDVITPVFKTRSPIEAETQPYRSSW